MHNETYFLELIAQHQGLIYKLIRMYAYTEEDIKDSYQEILFQAWKGFPAFKGEAKFSTWLYRICLNTLLTQNRKQNVLKQSVALENSLELHSHHNETDNEHIKQLYFAIRQLKETDRAIISLHLDGYNHQEIAEIVGISANNVGVKIYRIKDQIGILLKSYDK